MSKPLKKHIETRRQWQHIQNAETCLKKTNNDEQKMKNIESVDTRRNISKNNQQCWTTLNNVEKCRTTSKYVETCREHRRTSKWSNNVEKPRRRRITSTPSTNNFDNVETRQTCENNTEHIIEIVVKRRNASKSFKQKHVEKRRTHWKPSNQCRKRRT